METPNTDRSSSRSSSPMSLTSLEDSAVPCGEKLGSEEMETVSGNAGDTGPEQSVKGLAMDVEATASAPAGSSASGATGGVVVDGFDRMLQNHKNEIMFELRRLQMGDRPVTGQGNKEAVEHFFTRALNPDATTGANSDNHRPDSIVVEVNTLVERRPVSSLLQRAGFRRSIEHALRGAINAYRPPPPSSSVQSTRTPDGSRTTRVNTSRPGTPTEQTTSRVNRSATPTERGAQGRIPSPTLPHRPTESAIEDRSFPVQRQIHPTPVPQQPVSSYPTPPPLSPTQQVIPPGQQRPSGPRLAQQWLQQNVPANLNPTDQRQMSLGELMEEAQQEDFITEISDLLHRQLVTSSLDSTFRNRLEGLMRNHLEASGVDGRPVENLVQNLPRNILRNDFSHLGIQGPQQGSLSDHLDDISVISATAAVTVPYAQSNAAVSRELAAVKTQLQEMRNMMRLSFDLQLDIQRSIRQEVAAALSSTLSDMAASSGASPSTSAPPQRPASQPVSENTCLICLDSSVDSVLYQCGHMCVCHSCGMNLKSRGAHCPVCRAPIRDIIRAYRSNSD